MYSVSTARPLIFVLVISIGRGIAPALLPLRYRLRERKSAVASSMGSHSRTTDVWVALRQRRTGAEGEVMPKVVRMEFWRAEKDFWAEASEAMLRETVISTMLPEEIEGGRRIDGNSIWMDQSQLHDFARTGIHAYQTFVFSQKHGYAGVDFANSQRDQHRIILLLNTKGNLVISSSSPRIDVK